MKRKKSKFAIGFTLYLLLLFWLNLLGLALLWRGMDAYEKSRPDHGMEALLAGTDSAYWHGFLTQKGVSAGYVDTLDLEHAAFYKKMDSYTEETPVYCIRFGNEDMLTVSLKEGEKLPFGCHEWETGDIELAGSGLCIYIPQDAVIRIDGEAVGTECLVQENAQKLSLGIFDENRDDIGGLSKYRMDDIYDMEGVTVEDAGGSRLELAYSAGKSYYYAPLMEDYRITVPAGSTVKVNGIVLSEENSLKEIQSDEDFEGIEDFIPFVPGREIYTVQGLILPPEVTVETNGGNRLECTVEDGEYLYEIDDEISQTLSDYIMTVFDAYVAYSGNRNRNLSANYERYVSYLVPDSEAAKRAYMAQGSLKWTFGWDTKLKDAGITKYMAYSEDMSACQINFTLINDEVENANAYLFIFVKYNGEWRVVRILNKTSFSIE